MFKTTPQPNLHNGLEKLNDNRQIAANVISGVDVSSSNRAVRSRLQKSADLGRAALEKTLSGLLLGDPHEKVVTADLKLCRSLNIRPTHLLTLI